MRTASVVRLVGIASMTLGLAAMAAAEPAPASGEQQAEPAPSAAWVADEDPAAPAPIEPSVPPRDRLPPAAPPKQMVTPRSIPIAPVAQPPDSMVSSVPGVAAQVMVQTRLPEVARHGEPMPGEIRVRNQGAIAVDQVEMIAELGRNIELWECDPKPVKDSAPVRWSIGRLEPNQERIVQFKFVATASDELPGFQLSAHCRFQTTSTHQGTIAKAGLDLAIQGPSHFAVQEPATFSLDLRNVGKVPITNVVLRDTLPPGLSHPHGPELENRVGSLAPGENRKIRLTLVPVAAGKIAHRVVVTADGISPIERELPLDVEPARLRFTSQCPKSRLVQRPFTIEFSMTNPAAAPVSQVRLVAALPAGMTFAHASAGGKHDVDGHAVEWSLAELAPGESRSVSLTLVPTQLGELSGRATLLVSGKPVYEAPWQTRVEGAAALRIEITEIDDPIEVGAENGYEIRVINQGTVPATGVLLSAELPKDLQLVDAGESTIEKGATGEIRFPPVAEIAPKKDAIYRLKVRCLAPGDQRLRVTASSDQLARPICREESTIVYGDK